MKFILCVFLVIDIFCFTAGTVTDNGPADAIQFVIPVNHVFQLQTEQMKPILENENIKNRNVVVVSIAGAFRQGKSFLLNFFLRYLHAQVSQTYKFHLTKVNQSIKAHSSSTKYTMSPIGLAKQRMSPPDSNGEAVESVKPLEFGCGPKYSHMISKMVKK